MTTGDRIYIRIIDGMPQGVHEFVAPSFSGYNIYINSSLDKNSRIKAWEHAMEHIIRDDFNNPNNIQTIESNISNRPMGFEPHEP